MKKILFLITVSLFAGVSTFAQTRGHEIGFQSDNDSFLGQGSDRYYTNGFFLNYRHAIDFSKMKHNEDIANYIAGFEIGQKIYNAQSGRLPSADFVDRPVAGYLYLGISGNIIYKNEASIKVTARVGVVGPAAGGYPIQKFIHNTFGFYELNTWQYQVRNAPQFNLNFEVNKLLARGPWADISYASYINVGTGFNAAGVGPLIRLGNFNQLFNSVSTQSTVSKNAATNLLHKNELFFYYKPQINGILYDATVQGNIFKDHPEAGTQEITGDIKHLVFSNQLGVAFTTSRFVFDVGAVINTREVKQQVKSTHQWGSLSVLYRFN